MADEPSITEPDLIPGSEMWERHVARKRADEAEETLAAIRKARGDEAASEEEQEAAPEEGAEASADAAPDEEQEAVPDEEQEEESPRIPKARLDEVLQQNRELKTRLEALENSAAASAAPEPAPRPQFDYVANEKAYQQAVLEGNDAKAVELRNQERQAMRDEWEWDLLQRSSESDAQAVQMAQGQSAVARAEAKWPQFDKSSPQFDEDATGTALSLIKGYVASGDYSHAEAVNLATSQVAAMNRWDEGASGGLGSALRTPPEQRSREARDKAGQARRQPPPLSGVGSGNGQAPGLTLDDISRLSDADFLKLSSTQKASLRGDELS